VKPGDATASNNSSVQFGNCLSTPGTGLHTVGNKIFDASGKLVIIRGVNKSGTEYSCINNNGIFDPEGSDTLTVVQSIKSWTGVNAVRIPLNEDCWLAINGSPAAYSGANYQNAIKAFVDKLVQNNLIPVLELHWSAPGTLKATGQQPMMDRDHSVTFWSQVATAYKGYPNVIFDPHNEPYPDNNSDTNEAWRCWKDGGTCTGMSFQAAGMQEIVTAIRSAGANNLIMLGGVQYSNSLSQWLSRKPIDPANNLAASWHMYGGNICSSSTCWDQAPAAVAAQVPLIAGEFGEHYDGRHCTNTLVNTFMNWMDSKGAGYMAWTWNNWGECLDLVSNETTGTPTSWGTFFKNHVSALP
jgi:endoglucanase